MGEGARESGEEDVKEYTKSLLLVVFFFLPPPMEGSYRDGSTEREDNGEDVSDFRSCDGSTIYTYGVCGVCASALMFTPLIPNNFSFIALI